MLSPKDNFALRVAEKLRFADSPCPHGLPEVWVEVSPGIAGPGKVLCDACVMAAVRECWEKYVEVPPPQKKSDFLLRNYIEVEVDILPGEAPFIRDLDKNGENWPIRMVYANWLFQQGRLQQARLQRWLATAQKCPYYDQGTGRVPAAWGWYRHKKGLECDTAAVLPDILSLHKYWPFRTRHEAELALLPLLGKISDGDLFGEKERF